MGTFRWADDGDVGGYGGAADGQGVQQAADLRVGSDSNSGGGRLIDRKQQAVGEGVEADVEPQAIQQPMELGRHQQDNNGDSHQHHYYHHQQTNHQSNAEQNNTPLLAAAAGAAVPLHLVQAMPLALSSRLMLLPWPLPACVGEVSNAGVHATAARMSTTRCWT